MGFCTTRNPRTGREVLICDFCGRHPARKIRCPYGYCQSWATCSDCRAAGKHRNSSIGIVDDKGNPSNGSGRAHLHCKLKMEAKQRDLDAFMAGGLTLPIGSGNHHAATSVHGLFHVIGEHYFASCGAMKRTWYTRDELKALEALGHKLVFITEAEEKKIKEGIPAPFLFSTPGGGPAKTLDQILT